MGSLLSSPSIIHRVAVLAARKRYGYKIPPKTIPPLPTALLLPPPLVEKTRKKAGVGERLLREQGTSGDRKGAPALHLLSLCLVYFVLCWFSLSRAGRAHAETTRQSAPRPTNFSAKTESAPGGRMRLFSRLFCPHGHHTAPTVDDPAAQP